MRSGELTFASLFSGCGGFDIGFLNRGFRSRGAYDNDPGAVENFRANLPDVINQADLRSGVPNEQSVRGLDVLIAGPPCQGFSTAGKRQVDDERNSLLTLTGEVARRILPKVLVVENVAGALAGAHVRYWADLNGMLRDAGFRTHTLKCQVAELGMAQSRKRIFLLAWRTGREIRFTMPLKRAGRLADVLTDVSALSNHHPAFLKRGTQERRIASHIRPGQKLCNVRGGANAVPTWSIPEVFGEVTPQEVTILEMLRRLRRQGRARDFGDADPVSFSRLEVALGSPFRRLVQSLIAKGYIRRSGEHIDLAQTFNGKFRRLSWDRPSHTVDTRFGSPRYFLHPEEHRGFTVREAARIQGFPDHYRFCGDVKTQYRIIGNAVPPPLGQVAAEFASYLLKT